MVLHITSAALLLLSTNTGTRSGNHVSRELTIQRYVCLFEHQGMNHGYGYEPIFEGGGRWTGPLRGVLEKKGDYAR